MVVAVSTYRDKLRILSPALTLSILTRSGVLFSLRSTLMSFGVGDWTGEIAAVREAAEGGGKPAARPAMRLL